MSQNEKVFAKLRSQKTIAFLFVLILFVANAYAKDCEKVCKGISDSAGGYTFFSKELESSKSNLEACKRLECGGSSSCTKCNKQEAEVDKAKLRMKQEQDQIDICIKFCLKNDK